MRIRNPKYNASGSIDCEVEHPEFGWIDFTASENDVEPFGRKVYADALALGPADYVPPPPPSAKDQAYSVRRNRDRLLTASDWTQVADAPVDQAAWATYRQALRDVPQQAGFPDNITWPEVP